MPQALPILTFHHLGENGYPPSLFKATLSRLHSAGYTTIDLVTGVKQLKAGTRLPNKCFVLTFDDGYQSTYEIAAPLLDELGFTATLFPINVKAHAESSRPVFEGRPLLTKKEIRLLAQNGHAIGSHTLDHHDLRSLTLDEAARQLDESRDQWQQLLGSSIESFAYPYGLLNMKIRALVQERFSCACGTQLALNDATCDPYELNRIDMEFFNNPALAPLIFAPGFSTYLWARRKWLPNSWKYSS